MKGVVFLSIVVFIMGIYSISLNKNEESPVNESIEYELCRVYEDTDESVKAIWGYYSQNIEAGKGEARVFFIKNDDDAPEDFILDCIEKDNLPYIVIEGGSGIFDREKIELIARELGYFDTEIYVELYPVYSKPAYNTKAYREFFKDAYGLFKEYAPKTKIIWAVSPETVYEEDDVFPGEDYLDYVGFEMLLGLNGKRDCYTDELEYIFYRYKKPVFITRLGAAAYSEKEHKYFFSEKREYLQSALEAVTQNYLEVEGVIVFEAGEFEYEGKMNKIVFLKDEDILSYIAEKSEEFKERQKRYKRLNFTGIAAGGEAFAAYEDFKRVYGREYTAVNINGEKYVNLGSFADRPVFIENRVVILA